MKVLILEESADRSKLTPLQRSILTGKAFRDFLNAKCAPDPTWQGGKGWTIQDKDNDLSRLPDFYQKAQAKAKGNPMPRIVIGNDSAIIYEGPLPATVQEAIDLVNKFAPSTKPMRKAAA